ncbi:MAG: PLP-dependent aspartate aminotransferase family protein [Acidobacteriota bacterium]
MSTAPKIETVSVHAGLRTDPSTGAVAQPIHLSTTFERRPDGSLPDEYLYIREGNPNRRALETAVAALEGGGAAACFASGLASIDAVLRALPAASRVVAPRDIYHGTRVLLTEHHPSLQVRFVELSDLDAARRALAEPAALVLVETPSNPQLHITDIAGVVAAARRVGARVLVDNTWSTPVLQRPLELGADLVVHSSTKYFGGHSDVQGGVVVASHELTAETAVTDRQGLFGRIRAVQEQAGAAPAPFDCWLIRRGLQTLPCRMRAHEEGAAEVARALAEHPGVLKVLWPGLPSHPGHEVMKAQASGFGAMLSIRVRGGFDDASAVVGRCRLFKRATSLGGVESLIEHRAAIEGPETPTPPDLLRLSIGLEHPDDLVDDLLQALTG